MVFKFSVLGALKKPGNHACTFSLVLIFLFTKICQILFLLSKGKSGGNL